MKKNNIKPTGLKGQEQVNRMIELMGQTPIKEGVDRSVIELTKVGPDGKSYGIVRENHEYYIKIAEGTENLTKDSFNYIGGLKNKKDFVYPSYAKAIKHLNYKFKSLDEAYGTKSNINVFKNDSLVGEHHSIAMDKAFNNTTPMSKDIEKEYIIDKAGEDLSFDNKEGKEKDGFGDNVAEKSFMDELEDVKLSETEERIDQMITGDVKPDVMVSEDDIVVSKPLSILRGIEAIDDTIYNVTGEGVRKAMNEGTLDNPEYVKEVWKHLTNKYGVDQSLVSLKLVPNQGAMIEPLNYQAFADKFTKGDARGVSKGGGGIVDKVVSQMQNFLNKKFGLLNIKENAMAEAADILKGMSKEEVISILESVTGKKKV